MRRCQQAAQTFGQLDLAVSCAGILGAARVLGRDGPMAGSFFAKVIQVNLVGSFLLTKAAADAMQHNEPGPDGERGLIVNTASVAAFEGQIGQAAYAASKAGVAGMALPIAREFARIGVRVMTIAPGIFLTPMMDGMPEDVQQSLGAQVPVSVAPGKTGRVCRPGRLHLREHDAQCRDHSPRWRHSHATEVIGQGTGHE